MTRETIRDMLTHDPFEPFRMFTSAGEAFDVRDPQIVALIKSEVFIAHPNSDRRTFLPLHHIAAIDTLVSGGRRNGTASRRRRRR